MKKVLPFLLLLGAFRSPAQAPVPPAGPAHADSVATLRQVFRYARRHPRFGPGASGAGLGAQAASLASDRTGGSALFAYLVADRVRDRVRFSRCQEAAAVRRLNAHQPQPAYIAYRLALAARK